MSRARGDTGVGIMVTHYRLYRIYRTSLGRTNNGGMKGEVGRHWPCLDPSKILIEDH